MGRLVATAAMVVSVVVTIVAVGAVVLKEQKNISLKE